MPESTNDLIRIRNIIIRDPLALEKWPIVVDHIVVAATDVRKIKDLIRRESDYAEAVLHSLIVWNNETSANLVDLIKVLRDLHLNALADEILQEVIKSAQKTNLEVKQIKPTAAEVTTNVGTPSPEPLRSLPVSIFFDVGELVSNFVGREKELSILHKMVARSNSTPFTNHFCICGPHGIGKSTLARKFAYESYKQFGGNVIWIQADTRYAMKSSLRYLGLKYPEIIDPSQLTSDKLGAAIAALYETFTKIGRKVLFIFDGVEDDEVLRLIASTNHDDTEQSVAGMAMLKLDIMITSSRPDLVPLNNQLAIGSLDLSNAVKMLLWPNKAISATYAAAAKLAEKLVGHPLAVQMALITLNGKDSFAEYLNEFHETEFELSRSNGSNAAPRYLQLITISWCTLRKRIQKVESGKVAIMTLKVLSYLGIASCSVEFLTTIFAEDTKPSLDLLETLSLVTINRRSQAETGAPKEKTLLHYHVSAHPLLMEAIRLTETNQADEKVVWQMVEDVMGVRLDWGWDELTIERTQHGFNLLQFQSKSPELLSTKFEHYFKVSRNLLKYGQATESLRVAEVLSGALEFAFGPRHQFVIIMKWRVVQACVVLDKYKTAKQVLDPIYPLIKSLHEKFLTHYCRLVEVENAMRVINTKYGKFSEPKPLVKVKKPSAAAKCSAFLRTNQCRYGKVLIMALVILVAVIYVVVGSNH